MLNWMSSIVMILIELGSIGGDDATLVSLPRNEDERLKDVVKVFMSNIDQPEKLSEEDAVNIAAAKMQVTCSCGSSVLITLFIFLSRESDQSAVSGSLRSCRPSVYHTK